MRKSPKKVRVLLAPVYTIIFEIGQLFGGECEVCLKKMRKPKSGFTVHENRCLTCRTNAYNEPTILNDTL